MHSSILQASTLQQEDSWMSDLDPMLEGGYRVAYNHQCPFEIRRKSTEDQQKQYGTRDIMNVRIMATPSIEDYSQLKLQISSETDLFMVLEERIDDKKFNWIKKHQSLNFPFEALLPMLIKQFDLCDKHPKQYSIVLYLQSQGKHRLTIIQNIQYKSIELISLDFVSLDEETRKQYISYRFSLIRAKNQKLQLKTKQMLGMVKLKNPNLLQIIAKKTHNSMLTTQPIIRATR